MNAGTTMFVLVVAMMLMISSGLWKKRLEWRPRRVRVRIRRRRILR
jgi:hypothetical protein